MKRLGLAVVFVGVALLAACGKESECGFASANFANTELGTTLSASEKALEEAAIRFRTEGNEISLDGAFEKAALWERPYLTRARRLQALRQYRDQAQKVIQTYAPTTLPELSAKLQIVDAKILAETEARRNSAGNQAPALEGFEVTEKFLDDVTSLALAQEKLAAAGLQLVKHPNGEVVNTKGTAPEIQVKEFLAQVRVFFHTYRHELASPLIGKYVAALQLYLKASRTAGIHSK